MPTRQDYTNQPGVATFTGICPVMFVDWPWASHGPAWLDSLLLLVNVELFGGHDTEALLARSLGHRVDADDITGVLAGLAGFFVDASCCPAPPGLPTVRAFQRAQGVAVTRWLRERMG